MGFFSRPLASRTRASTPRWSTCCAADRRLERPLHPYRGVRAPQGQSCLGLALHQRTVLTTHAELGWKSLGSAGAHRAPASVKSAGSPGSRGDVLLVNGGDALYLCHWMRQSGLADLLPSLRETVWVGLSAGSMVMTPRIGEDFVEWKPPTGSDSTLGIVDFSIFPHLDHELLPENTMADAEVGGQLPGSGVRRQPDRHQSDRRHRRSRLRGALETVHPLMLACASVRECRLGRDRPRESDVLRRALRTRGS